MYKYETHLHTYPVSECARGSVRENLEMYKALDYDGVFITNHFLDGNINIDYSLPYEEKIKFWASDYEEGLKIGKEIGLKVFLGAELSYRGTDFLIYGPSVDWYLKNPQIMDKKKSEELLYFMENNALVVQAHPFAEAGYIDHIRLFPKCVHGVEVFNASKNEFQNQMAGMYAKSYELLELAGSDNHSGKLQIKFAGVCSETPVESEIDFVNMVKDKKMKTFNFVREIEND